MIETRIETITPEMATQYLSRNVKNRSIRKHEVEAYAREIKRGAFVVTHQGIAFDEEGNLLDGQHRLMAIAMAGQPVQMMVSRGVQADALVVVDRGASRTMRDIMVLSDTADGEHASMMRNGVMLSAMSQLVSCGYKSMKLTSNEVLKLFTAFGDHTMTAFRLCANKVGRSQIVSAALAAMQCGVSHENIEKFFQVFNKANIRGCESYNVQIVLNWRRQLDEAKLHGMAMSKKRVYLGTQSAIWHFVNNTTTTRIGGDIRQAKYDVTDLVKSVVES